MAKLPAPSKLRHVKTRARYERILACFPVCVAFFRRPRSRETPARGLLASSGNAMGLPYPTL